MKDYLKNNLKPQFPEVAAHVFVALEVFDPDEHCVRPYELQRLEHFLELTAEACQTCWPELVAEAEAAAAAEAEAEADAEAEE